MGIFQSERERELVGILSYFWRNFFFDFMNWTSNGRFWRNFSKIEIWIGVNSIFLFKMVHLSKYLPLRIFCYRFFSILKLTKKIDTEFTHVACWKKYELVKKILVSKKYPWLLCWSSVIWPRLVYWVIL